MVKLTNYELKSFEKISKNGTLVSNFETERSSKMTQGSVGKLATAISVKYFNDCQFMKMTYRPHTLFYWQHFGIPVPDGNVKNGRQHLKFVTSIACLQHPSPA